MSGWIPGSYAVKIFTCCSEGCRNISPSRFSASAWPRRHDPPWLAITGPPPANCARSMSSWIPGFYAKDMLAEKMPFQKTLCKQGDDIIHRS